MMEWAGLRAALALAARHLALWFIRQRQQESTGAGPNSRISAPRPIVRSGSVRGLPDPVHRFEVYNTEATRLPSSSRADFGNSLLP